MKVLRNVDRAITLEKVCFNWTIDHCFDMCIPRSWESLEFKKIYNRKIRDVRFNISNQNNMKFVNDVVKHKISVKKIPYMSSHEMYPELRTAIIDKRRQKELKNWLWEKEMKQGTGMFKCRRCKSDQTSYYSLQTRSADEPMTNYITCHSCEYHWKD